MTDDHLTHLDSEGRARMIDVGAKPITHRVAIAGGRLQTTAEVIALVRADGLPKADVLATARIAGISGAKKTSELIPLAHLLPLDGVTVDFDLGTDSIEIRAIGVGHRAHRASRWRRSPPSPIAGLDPARHDQGRRPRRGARRHQAHLEVRGKARRLDTRIPPARPPRHREAAPSSSSRPPEPPTAPATTPRGR